MKRYVLLSLVALAQLNFSPVTAMENDSKEDESSAVYIQMTDVGGDAQPVRMGRQESKCQTFKRGLRNNSNKIFSIFTLLACAAIGELAMDYVPYEYNAITSCSNGGIDNSTNIHGAYWQLSVNNCTNATQMYMSPVLCAIPTLQEAEEQLDYVAEQLNPICGNQTQYCVKTTYSLFDMRDCQMPLDDVKKELKERQGKQQALK